MDKNSLSDLVITKVHSVSTFYNEKNNVIKRSDRPRWAIVIKYEGETVYFSNGKRFISNKSHMVMLPKGSTYEWQCISSGHYSIVEFESDETGIEPISFYVKNSDAILKMIKNIEYNRTLKSEITEIESIRDAYSVLLMLIKSDSDKYLPSEKQKKINPAVEFISRNYSRSITNDELAALSGMSTVYFRKLFTDVMGVSPIVYARKLRIEKAKELLKSDYSTLSDVAQALGYVSLYDFSRDFKKHTGYSPSKYATR